MQLFLQSWGLLGSFVLGVGGWWIGAVLLFTGIAGVVPLSWRGLAASGLTAVRMLIVLVGSSLAYDRISQERDELRARLQPDDARFTITAAVPYTGIPAVVNRLIVPDVHVVNWSSAPIELRFTLLAADGSGSLGSVTPWVQTAFAGSVLPNPMLLPPHSAGAGDWLGYTVVEI